MKSGPRLARQSPPSDRLGWDADHRGTIGHLAQYNRLRTDSGPITDPERAKKESPFGGPVAHGFLTLSLLPGLSQSTLQVTGQGSTINYGAKSLRFLAPVPAGATLHARSRIAGAESKPKGTLLTTDIEVTVLGAEKPSLLYSMQLMYTAPR